MLSLMLSLMLSDIIKPGTLPYLTVAGEGALLKNGIQPPLQEGTEPCSSETSYIYIVGFVNV